jgi:hypothetical protein
MYKLFLDDIRYPKDVTWVSIPDGPWVVVRNYNQFVEHITKNGLPDFIAFDHDLADEHYGANPNKSSFTEKTGYSCAKWLVEYCMDYDKKFPDYVVHSMNTIGKLNIMGLVENFKSTIK